MARVKTGRNWVDVGGDDGSRKTKMMLRSPDGTGGSCRASSRWAFPFPRTFRDASRDWRRGAWLPVRNFIDTNYTTGSRWSVVMQDQGRKTKQTRGSPIQISLLGPLCLEGRAEVRLAAEEPTAAPKLRACLGDLGLRDPTLPS